MKFILLDRDGTINIDKGYIGNPEMLEFCPGTVTGLRRMRDSGMRFFIFTNQSGIGRGYFTLEDYELCEKKLIDMLGKEGIAIDAIRVCPHLPKDECVCRKPKTDMWDSLKNEFPEIDQSECIAVGDKDSDVLFGKNIGCRTARIRSKVFPMNETGDYTVSNLDELADILFPSAGGRVLPLAGVIGFAEKERSTGKRIVTTNGTFDLLHPGHLFLFEEARKQGDILIVGVNSDASVRRYKGSNRPIEPQELRAKKVSAYADAVFVFDDDTPVGWLKEIRPDVHVNAKTYGEHCVERPVLDEIGARLHLAEVRPELGSTTAYLH